MTLLDEVTALFQEDASSWSSIVRPVTSITWEDWENGASNTKRIFRRLEELTSSIYSMSKRSGISVELITKNAMALASMSQLPFARLTVLMLLRDGLMTGDEKEWSSALPTPSALELFLSHSLAGKFEPTAEAFAEALSFATKPDDANCIRNILLSISPFPQTSRALLGELRRFGPLSQASPEILVSAIKARIGEQTFSADIDITKLTALPQDWRRLILGHDGLSSLVLTPKAMKSIAAAPQKYRDTPASILGSTLKAELARELEKTSLSGRLITRIFANRPAAEALEKDFNWSLLSKLGQQIKLEEKDVPVPRFHDFLDRTSKGRLSGNLAAFVISGMPPGPVPRLVSETDVAMLLLESADLNVLRSSVKSARSTAQAFLVKSLVHRTSDKKRQKIAVNAFFSSSLDKDVDLPTLNALLPLASKTQRESAFKTILKLDSVCGDLLTRSEAFQSFHAARLKRGEIPKNCASITMLHAYGKLGEPGAQIIEELIKHRAKIDGRPSPKALLELMVQHAPALAGFVYESRGVSLPTFIRILDSDSFRTFPPSGQLSILKLRSNRGKPALHLAFRSISKPTTEWLGRRDEFRHLIALQAPAILKSQDLSLPELLAGTTISPAEAKTTLDGFDRSRLLNALPEALILLKDKPRVSAALELAVRSEISALSVFMRLASRLAPPFKKTKYGRRFDDLYTTYELPKRSGGKRIISAPAVHLKIAQRALLKLLYAEGFSDQAMGFVPGRSIRDNAAKHTGRDIVVNADVKGFFPSTSYKRVYSLSRRLCKGTLSPLAARLFSEICCHDGHLATGAPTSPAVSNLIMRDLDGSLDRIATKLDVTYTRYADDLTFSGQSAAVWMLKPLKTHLAKLGYELDPKKTNIFRKGRRQVVTGAVVNQKVNLARPLRKLLRAAVDHRVKGKQPFFHGKPMIDAVLYGYLSYLKMLSPESAEQLISKLRASPGWKY
jgi:retron-type reverse transcriptase